MAENKKNNNFIAYIISFCIIIVELIFLMLSIFSVLPLKTISNKPINHLQALVVITITSIILILSVVIKSVKKLKNSTVFEYLYYIGMVIFINCFVVFGFNENIWLNIIITSYLSYLISCFSISIYFSFMKKENYVKANNLRTTIFFTFTIMIMLSVLIIILQGLLSLIPSVAISLNSVIINFTALVLMNSVFLGLFYGSLIRNKNFINSCLII
ncbi:MAG: hypothetical protein RR334_00595 [Clostridia bacterium]